MAVWQISLVHGAIASFEIVGGEMYQHACHRTHLFHCRGDCLGQKFISPDDAGCFVDRLASQLERLPVIPVQRVSVIVVCMLSTGEKRQSYV